MNWEVPARVTLTPPQRGRVGLGRPAIAVRSDRATSSHKQGVDLDLLAVRADGRGDPQLLTIAGLL